MPEYRVIANEPLEQSAFETKVNDLGKEGWKPILMSTAQASPNSPVSVTVVFERTRP